MAAGKLDAQAVTNFLNLQSGRLPHVAYVRATNEHGDVAYGTRIQTPPTNNADRNYFKQLKNDKNAGLLVVNPVIARIDNRWVWTFARRVSKPDGSFGGVIFAAIYVDDVEKIISALKIGTDDSIALD